MRNLWIIEARNEDGSLSFAKPQPEEVFGLEAITGITEDRMAQVIYRLNDSVVLDGGSIHTWPATIDHRFQARRKTW